MLRRLIRAWAPACALILAPPAAAADPVPTAADLVAPPAFSDPLLSPDGARVAARVTAGDEERVAIVPLAGERHADPVALPQGGWPAWYRWAGSARLVICVLEEAGAYLVVADADGGTAVLRPDIPGFDGEGLMHVDRTGRFLLASASPRQGAPPAVYRIDLASGAAARVAGPRAGVWEWHVDAAGSLRPGIGAAGRDAPLLQRVRGQAAAPGPALKARIEGALGAGSNRIVSASGDGVRLLVLHSSPADPGSYYLFDAGAGAPSLLARVNPALAGKKLATVEQVHYAARDGLRIAAYLALPPGSETAAGLPLVVMPHGGPFARDHWEYDPWVQYLAARGYAVLQPNFRGSTGFGRAFLAAGDGQWGRGMQDDIDDGVKWLAASGRVDAGRVCIMGASFGGYAAMWAAVRNPDLYRCAISYAGISDIAAQLAYDRPGFDRARDFAAWRARILGRERTPERLSPLHQAARMRVPILIAHGGDDRIVPPDQSQRLHAALAALGREHEFLLYRQAGHDLDDPADAADFLERAGAFLARHNPVRP